VTVGPRSRTQKGSDSDFNEDDNFLLTDWHADTLNDILAKNKTRVYPQRGSEHHLIGGTTKSRGRAIAAGPTARVACPTK